MTRFIVETRRQDGTPYLPSSLVQLASGIQRHLPSQHFEKALDSKMKKLTHAGYGVKVKRADPILTTDEEQIWDSNVMSLDTSDGLSNAVFFYNCKVFGFRGMDEHRNLEASQFQCGKDISSGKKFICFNGRLCKNVSGGLNQRKVELKEICHYEDEGNPRCVVKIFEKYLQLIPSEGPFYRKPLPNQPNNVPHFSCQVIGENKLACRMKTLFQQANIDMTGRRITNHSGKVTCCTTLLNAGFDDAVVRGRSGHRSDAVNLYKRPLRELQQSVSDKLQPPNPNKENATPRPSPKCFIPEMKPSTSTCDTTSMQTDNNSLQVFVPSSVSKVIIVKNGKKIVVEL